MIGAFLLGLAALAVGTVADACIFLWLCRPLVSEVLSAIAGLLLSFALYRARQTGRKERDGGAA